MKRIVEIISFCTLLFGCMPLTPEQQLASLPPKEDEICLRNNCTQNSLAEGEVTLHRVDGVDPIADFPAIGPYSRGCIKVGKTESYDVRFVDLRCRDVKAGQVASLIFNPSGLGCVCVIGI